MFWNWKSCGLEPVCVGFTSQSPLHSEPCWEASVDGAWTSCSFEKTGMRGLRLAEPLSLSSGLLSCPKLELVLSFFPSFIKIFKHTEKSLKNSKANFMISHWLATTMLLFVTVRLDGVDICCWCVDTLTSVHAITGNSILVCYVFCFTHPPSPFEPSLICPFQIACSPTLLFSNLNFILGF